MGMILCAAGYALRAHVCGAWPIHIVEEYNDTLKHLRASQPNENFRKYVSKGQTMRMDEVFKLIQEKIDAQRNSA